MGALSDFAFQQQLEREALCSQLVCSLLPVQPDDSNHGAAMQYCLQNLEKHRFGDVSLSSVESDYTRLAERLSQHSQTHKQQALAALVSSLLKCTVESKQLDPHHNVLSMVYWLAQRPLESPWVPEDDPDDAASEAEQSDLSEASNWAEDADLYSSDSQLSDWEHEGSAQADSDSADANLAEALQLADQAITDMVQAEPSPLELIKHLRQKLSAHLPSSPLKHDHHSGCLSLRLAHANHYGPLAPSQAPSSKQCTNEHSLMLQVLHMLRGAQAPGPALTLDKRAGQYVVVPGTHVPFLSQGSLHHVLGQFAAVATDMFRLQKSTDKVQMAVTFQPWHASQPQAWVSATLAAFAAAVKQQIRCVHQAVVQTEEALSNQINKSVAAPQLTLLSLEHQLQGVTRRVSLLKHVWQEALPYQGQPLTAPVTPSQLSCDVLTKLGSLLHHHSLQGGPQGQQETAVLLQLLVQSMQPMLQALQAWLYAGLLDNSAQDFFICEDQRVSVESPDFWTAAYTLRRSADGQVACPAFLQPLAQAILSTGKSLILLRTRQGKRQRLSPVPQPRTQQTLWQQDQQVQQLSKSTSALHHFRAERQGSLSQRFLHKLRTSLQVAGLEQHAEQGSKCFASLTQPSREHQRMHSSTTGSDSTTIGDQNADSIMQTKPAAVAEATSQSVAAVQAASTAHQGTMQGQGPSIGERMAQMQAAWQPSASGQAPAAAWGIPKGPSLSGYAMPAVASYSKQFQGVVEKAQQQLDSQQDLHTAEALGMQQQHLHPLQTGLMQQPAYLPSQVVRHPPQPETEQQQQQQQQQQSQQQQQQHEHQRPDGSLSKHPVDDRVLEWCSKAEQLLPQQSAAQHASGQVSASVQGQVGLGLHNPLVALLPYQGFERRPAWGKQNGGEEEAGVLDKQWLDELQGAEIPPINTLLHNCLVQPIQDQIDLVGSELLGRLLREWGLMHQLSILRNVFLLGCPLLMPFASALYAKLHKGHKLLDMSQFELEIMLQHSLSDEAAGDQPGADAIPHADGLSVYVKLPDTNSSMHARRGSRDRTQTCNIAELLPLGLHYQVPWPLSIIVDDTVLQQYNQVLIFLLQIRWAKWSLERVRVKAGRAGANQPLQHGHVLAHQLSHFVNTLHQFVMDRLLHGAWHELQQALEAAKSLEEVTLAHQSFMASVHRQCLLAPDKTWKLIEGAVVSIFNEVLYFAELQQQLLNAGTRVAVPAVLTELQALHVRFRDRHRYLMKVLTAKTLKIGGDSELHHLVMRINYNGFYAKADEFA